MALTEKEALEIGAEEDKRWRETHAAVVKEIRRAISDFNQDSKLARELTAEIVASRRDEDKAALASDEAVAHGLSKLRKNKTEGLESLEEQPYFARVVTEEGDKSVEFRLGTESFPDQRIIDWRKAPISKLYYDYREGDEFFETIQGREREGVIGLRRSYQGKRENLHVVETAQGNVYREKEGWKAGEGKEQPASRSFRHDGHLPPILSLITPEQFQWITRDPGKPIVIQGVAGSGKTTVALHRLAWLLHKDNGGLRPEKCLVVMFNRSLKTYIQTTLPELNVKAVPIRTFHQWANQIVTELFGVRTAGNFKKSRELEMFKSSAVCFEHLFKFVEKFPDRKTKNKLVDLFVFFNYLTTLDLFFPKWDAICSQLKEQIKEMAFDFQDDSILLNLVYIEHGYYPVKDSKSLGVCDHIVIDEVQDFGLMEIRALLNALDQKRTVTLVGDTAQKIVMGRNFDSWEIMLKDAGFEETTPITLTVSHRSTQEIMEVASRLRSDGAGTMEAPRTQRSGPSPTFIRAEGPQVLPNLVGQWIGARLKENPHALSSVICRWPKEAQKLVEELRKLGYPSVRLGHRDQFDFSPGVTVTNVHQVKGLEFRNVLIVEPSEENYKLTSEEERNLLYVAVTRAEQRLDAVGCKRPVFSFGSASAS
ncbi:MAG: AAA family ATPase [Deltaproteobacteria bacterium]|nr:AAA family ATPase [Deltaproteobacteria bacterium]